MAIEFLDHRKTESAVFDIELEEADENGKLRRISPGRYEGAILISGSNFNDLRIPLVLDIYDRYAWVWTSLKICGSALVTGFIALLSGYVLYRLQQRRQEPRQENRTYLAE